jgi:hypothetical protein
MHGMYAAQIPTMAAMNVSDEVSCTMQKPTTPRAPLKKSRLPRDQLEVLRGGDAGDELLQPGEGG